VSTQPCTCSGDPRYFDPLCPTHGRVSTQPISDERLIRRLTYMRDNTNNDIVAGLCEDALAALVAVRAERDQALRWAKAERAGRKAAENGLRRIADESDPLEGIGSESVFAQSVLETPALSSLAVSSPGEEQNA
jgi:hypothetical protein